jgi:hypothetical protein
VDEDTSQSLQIQRSSHLQLLFRVLEGLQPRPLSPFVRAPQILTWGYSSLLCRSLGAETGVCSGICSHVCSQASRNGVMTHSFVNASKQFCFSLKLSATEQDLVVFKMSSVQVMLDTSMKNPTNLSSTWRHICLHWQGSGGER